MGTRIGLIQKDEINMMKKKTEAEKKEALNKLRNIVSDESAWNSIFLLEEEVKIQENRLSMLQMQYNKCEKDPPRIVRSNVISALIQVATLRENIARKLRDLAHEMKQINEAF